MEEATVLIRAIFGIGILTLLSVVGYGYKIVRFINEIEFKVNIMWKDYENRIEQREVNE